MRKVRALISQKWHFFPVFSPKNCKFSEELPTRAARFCRGFCRNLRCRSSKPNWTYLQSIACQLLLVAAISEIDMPKMAQNGPVKHRDFGSVRRKSLHVHEYAISSRDLCTIRLVSSRLARIWSQSPPMTAWHHCEGQWSFGGYCQF